MEELNLIASNLEAQRLKVPETHSLEELMGLEGFSTRRWFAAFRVLIKERYRAEFSFISRNRRPPRDRFNAGLSYLYSLLYTRVLQNIISCGLDPGIGYLHSTSPRALALVLDLMEIFRLPLVDITWLAAINRGHFDASSDFCEDGKGVFLSESGRRKAVHIFEERLKETWKHPVASRSISWARCIELEIRLLAKVLEGHPIEVFGDLRFR